MTAESGLDHMPGSEGAPEAVNMSLDVSYCIILQVCSYEFLTLVVGPSGSRIFS
jgi:hypothetical protein